VFRSLLFFLLPPLWENIVFTLSVLLSVCVLYKPASDCFALNRYKKILQGREKAGNDSIHITEMRVKVMSPDDNVMYKGCLLVLSPSV
jgi:hypothetical protein